MSGHDNCLLWLNFNSELAGSPAGLRAMSLRRLISQHQLRPASP